MKAVVKNAKAKLAKNAELKNGLKWDCVRSDLEESHNVTLVMPLKKIQKKVIVENALMKKMQLGGCEQGAQKTLELENVDVAMSVLHTVIVIVPRALHLGAKNILNKIHTKGKKFINKQMEDDSRILMSL